MTCLLQYNDTSVKALSFWQMEKGDICFAELSTKPYALKAA